MIILGEVNIIWVMTYETSYPYTVFAFFEFRFGFSGTQAIEKCCLSQENKIDEDHPYQDVVRIVQLTGGSQYLLASGPARVLSQRVNQCCVSLIWMVM
jgi:hypothetical protein